MSKTFVVVNSCSGYSDAWKPFVRLLRKFWPECPYEAAIISDGCHKKWEGDLEIDVGNDQGWMQNLAMGLARFTMDSKIILLQEDFFFCDFINQIMVEMAVKKLDDNKDISCIRLYPCPGPNSFLDSNFGLIDKDAEYRISCQAAIWRCDYLQDLLRKLIDEHGCSSPADFEIVGTRSKPIGEFLSVYRDLPAPLPYLVSAISRGKWNPDAIKLCKKFNIPIDTSRRGIE